MSPIVDLLASSPLLMIFLVVALGAAVGMIPFGPVRFGAAGALFVGLALGALDPRLGEDLALVQTLGLALFVYTVGLAAGAGFLRDLRRQYPLMILGLIVLVAVAGLAAGAGRLLGVDHLLTGGTYTGALTSTPALGAAQDAAGSDEPAVGYSLAYPVGVLVAILAVALVVRREWPAPRDPESAASEGLTAVTAEVERRTRMSEVPGYLEQSVRMSYLARESGVRVVGHDEALQPGDHIVVVGAERDVAAAVSHLGHEVPEHLAHDRRSVDHQRFVVSHQRVAGRTVDELDIPGRFHGVITRVRRGDLDLLAGGDLRLELGDRVLAVVPREQLERVTEFFGDSERKVSGVDAVTTGLGMSAGLAVGLIVLPLPGGVTFALGSAAGPLVIGMVLGALERTGPLVWGMPQAANLTIRQIGLLLFLAAVGLSSGQAFASQALTGTGLRVVILSALIIAVTSVAFLAGARLLGLSAPRSAGAFAGLVGQPAILSYASSRVVDERVESGYASMFALGIIVKIAVVQLLVG
ncbi:aspartate:alanine exchanger family transporter [Bogoriella caseilytica]|uniref:Putative transport protein n=1 Tax=Bogoriella caseilytica TaxID=56055 RepID=A0A3N2B9V7_9MICO|nr:TrkA C-terminal domain-containing protein [Bogoriella caseilytica]ROR72037.1 putative transport protein [Bogoriella caseilytica]